MNEEVFLKALAVEAMNKDDQRLKDLIGWCKNITKMIQACSGDVDKQEIHAIATASSILAELNYVEETGESMYGQIHTTSFTLNDPLQAIFTYRPTNEARIISVSASVVSGTTGQQQPGWSFESIVLPMRPVAE